MPENSEKSAKDVPFMRKTVSDIPDPSRDMEVYPTAKLQVVQPVTQLQTVELKRITETPVPLPSYYGNVTSKKMVAGKINARDAAIAHTLLEQCRQLCLSLFAREHDPVRSLGFASSMGGEGKSLLALVTAQVLAQDSNEPVTLIECNWEHPTLHDYFGIPATPGLAEWLRGTCQETDIRYRVNDNLMVIPAGEGRQDAVKLLKRARQQGLAKLFGHPNELFIVDLPPVITSSYGSLAASLAEAVVVVVRSEAISMDVLTKTCAQVKEYSSLYGIILNQKHSHIPRWIQQIL